VCLVQVLFEDKQLQQTIFNKHRDELRSLNDKINEIMVSSSTIPVLPLNLRPIILLSIWHECHLWLSHIAVTSPCITRQHRNSSQVHTKLVFDTFASLYNTKLAERWLSSHGHSSSFAPSLCLPPLCLLTALAAARCNDLAPCSKMDCKGQS